MEIDQEVSSSGYSSSSSYSILGYNKAKRGAVNFEMLQSDRECLGLGPQTSTYSNETRYLEMRHRLKTEMSLKEDRMARQQLLKNKRKRTRQAIIEQNRPFFVSDDNDTIVEHDDDEDVVYEMGDISPKMFNELDGGVYIDEVDIVDMTDDGIENCLDMLCDIDESDLSESELSFFGCDTDTEREEDGYTTADFDDTDPESDAEIADIALLQSVGSTEEEIVRIRFPFMSMRVFLSDVYCLMDDAFVNDTIVDFCLNHMVFNELPEDVYKIHTFPSTFFYYLQMQLFREGSSKDDAPAQRLMRRFSRLAPFVENLDIFENDFLVFPMNDMNHWSLCIVCCPQLLLDEDQRAHMEKSNVIAPKPCIIMFDSQYNEQPNLEKYGGHIREFLQFAYIYNHGYCDNLSDRFSEDKLKIIYPQRLPQQTNMYDCGLYLLEYAKNFFMNPPNMEKATTCFDFLAEYPQFSTTNKRAALRREILSMNEQYESLLKHEL
ncbi:unnamed protein product [Bursaphelenchus okinawaensis]|uniref:Ubiquitin-like protease family profile domain-containing protein n=1 Tax=Bursaphelenchus okinawaensis TaxID=465554 RepID=A0A811K6G1_9BILA|nr:unnamed protein product [Bursaphelenchus okinawaensis]CAG9093273.1 unnamed protein product [Bursaphelenchus okinawaensis]